MPQIRIPRVCIYIPGIFSFQKFEPAYVLKMYQAIWRNSIADPSDPVRIIATPAGVTENECWKVIDGTFEEAVEYEAARLRSEFGVHMRTGEPIFDVVYPGGTFEAEFKRFVAAGQAAAPEDAPKSDVEVLIEAIPGLGSTMSKRVIDAGYTKVESLAYSSVSDLAKIIGKDRAKDLIKSAQDAAGIEEDPNVVAASNV